MSRLLYAWEFGANFGHIGSFLPLARTLRQRGHDVHWAVSQTGPAARLLAADDFAWLQAPTCTETPRAGTPLSYNDILLRFGYARSEDLLGLVVAWRELMRLSEAQAVLADHAPTAILAARTLSIPVILFSSGFYAPPRQRPLPNMRPWLALPPGQLDALESEALASINAILRNFGQRPLAAVEQLFDVAEDTLLGFPELDHYTERGPARYWGNLSNAGIGAAPAWPAMPGKRIFAYLRTGTRHHEAALAALHALGQPSVVFFPDAPAALLARYTAPHLVFSPSPLDLTRTAQEADAALTYAGLSTATSFLLAGKPQLLLPGHLEQFLLARRVEQMGAGLLLNPEQPPVDLQQKLRRILFEVNFALNAKAFSRRYVNFPQNTVTKNLVSRIEEIAGAGL
jgi:UDP:flavonoid glycosyltransferase YjiC (YdhE family)